MRECLSPGAMGRKRERERERKEEEEKFRSRGKIKPGKKILLLSILLSC